MCSVKPRTLCFKGRHANRYTTEPVDQYVWFHLFQQTSFPLWCTKNLKYLVWCKNGHPHEHTLHLECKLMTLDIKLQLIFCYFLLYANFTNSAYICSDNSCSNCQPTQGLKFGLWHNSIISLSPLLPASRQDWKENGDLTWIKRVSGPFWNHDVLKTKSCTLFLTGRILVIHRLVFLVFFLTWNCNINFKFHSTEACHYYKYQ